jgi:hypothetical protein
MAVSALADGQGMKSYGPPDASLSEDPETLWRADPEKIREPVETGAIPHRSESSQDQSESGDPTFRPGGP